MEDVSTITINHRKIPFELKRSSKANRLRLQIKSDEPRLVLTAPRWVLGIQIDRFLEAQSDWIEKHWDKLEKQVKRRPKPTYKAGDTFYYFGEVVTLSLIPSSSWKPSIRVRGNLLEIFLHRDITKSEGLKAAKKAVEEFYKAKASEVIHDRLQHFNQHYTLAYKRVTFRNQKTRWGSCSSAKNLNFNWRLIMAPIEVIDYVVVHELCHLGQMNHSKKFWALVGETHLDYVNMKKWLKENQYLLSI